MCGLAGFARFGEASPVRSDDPLLAAMTRCVAHRGPDEQVTEAVDTVGLGFTRLALVAPDAGDQPLWTADRQAVLIANGEVYNHRELAQALAPRATMRTGSDCEVLPYLYQESGRDFLRRVNGMFAIVLYDVARRRLILARDRFGIKPLYFHRDAERIVFASEIKALFADPRTPRAVDWAAALHSPVLQSAPALQGVRPTSWFQDIEYVEPGTVLEIDLVDGRTSTYRYWDFPGDRPILDASDREVTAEYGRLLGQAVTDCASADAELGLFLSGGVDSAAVAALAAKSRELHTFTILSPSTLESGDAYYSDLVARQLGLPNHQVHVPADHVPGTAEWLRFVWLMENPMVGAEAYLKHELYRYARATRPELKGMLLGAASDEFNGGYSEDFAGGGGWPAFRANLDVMARRGAARGDVAAMVWNEAVGAPVLRSRPTGDDDAYRLYLQAEYRKIYQYNVWHEDRSAAGSGVEARVPFLDHRLVELVTSIPPHRRESLLWNKRIVRDAVVGMLPPEVIEREKVPFVHGVEGVRHTRRMLLGLLTANGRELVTTALATPGAREHLDGAVVHGMIDAMAAGGDAEPVDLLLRLVNLGLLEHQLAELPPALVDWPAPPIARRWPEPDFTDQGRRLARQLVARPEVALDAVPGWAEDVLPLQAVGADTTRFLVRDGALEYVVDDENPAWWRLVGEIDGDRPLGALLAAAQAGVDEVQDELFEAVESGLLVLRGPDHPREPA